MISLDGSFCEGGGQIVRTALAVSCITGKSFEVSDIRKGRCEPGLKNQHLYCAKALQAMCDAKVEGDKLGSTYLKFEPGKWKPKPIEVDLQTAGSITLFMQAMLPPFMFGKRSSTVTVIGGTDVQWSMPVDYFKHVLIPQLIKWADVEMTVLKRGYHPKGQGRVEFKIKPRYTLSTRRKAPGIDLVEQGNIVLIRGVSHASKDLEKAMVADRQAKAAKFILDKLGSPVEILSEYSDTVSTGSGIAVWAIFGKGGSIDIANPIRIGADCLGERNKKAEDVGIEAAERLKNEIGYQAPVDEYLADNLVPFVALFGGRYKVSKVTNHLLTNIYVIEKFFGEGVVKVDRYSRIVESAGVDFGAAEGKSGQLCLTSVEEEGDAA
ncbi:MAG: RNA 3'-terminal phosphate cyclase [Nanoarchaeota archaeon]